MKQFVSTRRNNQKNPWHIRLIYTNSVVGWGNTVGFCEEIMKIWEQGQFLVLNIAGIGHLQKNFQGAQKCYVLAKILALMPKTPKCFAGLPQNSRET